VTCAQCGAELSPTASFCQNCGRSVAPSATPTQPSTSPPLPTQAKKPNCFGIGCLGLLGLFLFTIIVSAIVSNENNSTQPSGVPSHQVTVNEKAIVPKEEADVKAAFGLLNQYGRIVTGYAIGGTSATVQVDQDAWDPMSDQDKHLLEQGLEGAWTTTWDQHHNPHGPTSLHFYIEDMAHDNLFTDVITLPDTSHAERTAYEQSRLSGAGAYKVVEQWSWCGDGLGQRAIVLSHNPNDLVPAFHRFLASLDGDRSKCIMFEVFTDQATLDQSKSISDDYPDSELVHQWTHELQYTNNPNTGLEEWDFGITTLSDGTHDFVQHVVHPASN
jgi:hypothetical protein